MGFRSQVGSLVQFQERRRGVADIYMVYGREAFPRESRWPAPVPDGRPVADPRTGEERLAVARRFAEHVTAELPILVDGPANGAMTAYDAYPFRLYALSPDGRIAVESIKGATGFEETLARIEDWLGGLRE